MRGSCKILSKLYISVLFESIGITGKPVLSNIYNIDYKWKKIGTGGISRIPATSKMELFVIIVNGYPLTIATDTYILDVGRGEGVLDMVLMSSL